MPDEADDIPELLPEDTPAPEDEEDAEVAPPPPAPEPVPLRRSEHLRKIPTCPGNVYGEGKHLTQIESDIQRTKTWKEMMEPPGSSEALSDLPTNSNLPGSREKLPIASDDKVDDLLHLMREGGVKFLDYLLAKAVPPDPESPDTSKVREWTFWDILKMPSETQKEWKQACCKELESLHRCKVFELVDPPKDRKVICN